MKKNAITLSLVINMYQKKCWECDNVKLLGIEIDSNLTFNNYVSSICTKTGRKLTALRRILSILNLQQKRVLMKHPHLRVYWKRTNL